MARSLNDRDFSRLAAGAKQLERELKKTADAQMKEIGRTALETGPALLELFELLPAAMIAARGAEYERILARYDEKHPRAVQMETSLIALQELESQAARGRARAARVMEAARAPGVAFHGFVSDEDGEPLSGMTVQLTGHAPFGKTVARTESDGYFRMPLPVDGVSAGAESGRLDLSETTDRAAQRDATQLAVQIRDTRGALVFEDPVPLQIGPSGAYREYRIGEPSEMRAGSGNVPGKGSAEGRSARKTRRT
jgi:hypothetical protein